LLNTVSDGPRVLRVSVSHVVVDVVRDMRGHDVRVRCRHASACRQTVFASSMRARRSIRRSVSPARGTRFAPRARMSLRIAIAGLACLVRKRVSDVERHVRHVDARASMASTARAHEENSRALSHLRIVFFWRASQRSRVAARVDDAAAMSCASALDAHACSSACRRKPA
jgi:hypothetical protein